MKTQRFNIALVLFLLLSFGVMARTEVKKEYHEKYSTNKNTTFSISNRYGKIDIKNTTADEMTIDVVVSVEASSERKAQDILDRIGILLANDNNKIAAITDIDGGWSGNVNVNIDYTVLMPHYVHTSLENKYGNVSIEEITGRFKGEVKYGNFRAYKLVADDNSFIMPLYFAYCGSVSVQRFSKMKLELAYSSKTKLGGGDAIEFEAKYSGLNIGQAAIVKGELAYTDFDLGQALNVDLEAKYSDMDMGDINGSLEVEMKYGDLGVDLITKDFDLVIVEGGYSDIDINVEKGARYKLSMNASYGEISFPPMQVEHLDDEGTDESVFGYVGGAGTDKFIEIKTRYGDAEVNSY